MSSAPQPKPGIAQNLLADRQSLPGLIPQEIVIFKAWWSEHYQEYTSYNFNVRTGLGFDPGPNYDQSVRTDMVRNSQRRIDALLYAGAQPTIVEVKYRGTPLAIGQILAYRELWLRDNPGVPQPVLLLICYQIDADTVYCAGKLGVVTQLVQADFTGIKITKQD